MTVHIPLASCSQPPTAGQRECEAGPSTLRSFGTPSLDPIADLKRVIDSLRLAKRIVVVSGAGVSTAANIPDFRSASGLFTSASGHHPNLQIDDKDVTRLGTPGKARRTNQNIDIKDLFHVRCLSSPTLLAEHQALISSLATMSRSANPTAFHSFLRTLDDSGRLLRCYTQNIDGLEGKAGLTVGIPPKSTRKGKGKMKGSLENAGQEAYPSVIPLHGLLSHLHCQQCHISLPLFPFLPLPTAAIPCPTCELSSTIRSALSERTRKSGVLRASVVLYGEEHPQGDLIGSVVEKDLTKKAGADFLLVTGTSLSVPGVKRLVKEMCKRVKTSSSGGKKKKDEEKSVKTVFVNNEPPAKIGEWKEVFDVWIQGDIQEFISYYLDNPFVDNISAIKEEVDIYPLSPSTPSKRRISENDRQIPPTPKSLEKKRKISETKPSISTPRKKKPTNGRASTGTGFPPTPESLPRSQIKRSKSDMCKYRNDRRSMSPSLMREKHYREGLGSLTPLSDE